MSYCYFEYLKMNGEDFFTVVLLPAKEGKFPTIICRSPYVSGTSDMPEEEIVQSYRKSEENWVAAGYAVIHQHCRGQGKSTGAFVPYIHEREDGLALRAWLREQPFYNGEIFLYGASYTASLHYATAPFEKDIKGAVFEAQDSERYRLWYRHGQMRKGHANWHFALYKNKCHLDKKFNMRSFSELPLAGLSERVLGDRAEDFEQMLTAPSPDHGFWQTRFGGSDARDAVSEAGIAILLTTGYNDFYVGGVFDMWRKMSEGTKRQSALLVSPYNHGDGYDARLGLSFPSGGRSQAFGKDYQLAWFEHIRRGTPLPFDKGVITYYRTFENGWQSDPQKTPTHPLTIPLGGGAASFIYDPANPPAFRAEGLFAEELNDRRDVVSVYTPPFDKDTFVKGQMQLHLSVSSDCPDTSFYARISIVKQEYTYVLRHDITSLCYQLGDYTAGKRVSLDLCFDEYAFLIAAGERLRVDISSTDDNTYVVHTNRRGEYYEETSTVVAENTVYLEESFLVLPVE